MEECLFLANRATAEDGAVDNNTISSNISPAVTRTSFVSNSTASGGAMYNNGAGDISRPTFTDCAFVNNQATNGEAIYNRSFGSGSTLTNCSFLGNSAASGGAMYNNGSGVSPSPLRNCVLFGNGGSTTFATVNVSGPTSIELTYSMFEPTSLTSQVNSSGPGNLTTIASPFISMTSVSLAACSPAINAGLNSLNSTTVDLAGNPRVVEGFIDMGVVEFQGATTLAVGVTANSSLTITQGQTAILTASGALSYS